MDKTSVSYLLNDLCAQQGFCLPEKMRERLIKFPPNTAQRFARAVIELEGLHTDTMDKNTFNRVLEKVEEAFKNYESTNT